MIFFLLHFMTVFVSQLINVAFLTLSSTPWQVPRAGVVRGVQLTVTGYTDGTAANQTKAGLFPLNPTAANFTDNQTNCLVMLGFNSTAVAGFPIAITSYVPLNFPASAGKILYLAGTSSMALGGSAYAVIQFEG
jgi:hypothetical protein